MAKCGGLENRLARKGHGGSNPSSSANKLKATLKLRRFFFRSKTANACLFYPSFIPTVSKTVRPERAAVWKTVATSCYAGSLYSGFGSIQCCLGLAGDLTFCDQIEELGLQGCRRVIVADCHLG